MGIASQFDVLEDLGLTSVQSKVLFANCSIGPSTAKQIANFAQVAREEVYRVMPDLQKSGFVKKHIGKPTLFETIELQKIIDLLIERRETETNKILNAANQLKTTIKKKNEEKTWINFEEELILLSSNDIIDITISRELDELKKSLEIVVNWECHRYKGQLWADEMMNLLKSGIEIRVIMNLPKKEAFTLPDSTIELMNNPEFQVGYTKNTPKHVISLYDRNRGFIFNSNNDCNLNPPVLWTNNSTILGLMQFYFDMSWNLSLKMSFPELCKYVEFLEN